MHYWHALLVKAETPDDAVLEAGRFLEMHKKGVWDFYNIAGRWTGVHGNDVLSVHENEEKVRSTIEAQLAAQKTSLQQRKTKLAEKAVDLDTLITPHESYELTGDPSTLMWAGAPLELAGRLVGNEYCIESWFWDVEEDSSYLTEARWTEIVGEGDFYWLVAVDLHRSVAP